MDVCVTLSVRVPQTKVKVNVPLDCDSHPHPFPEKESSESSLPVLTSDPESVGVDSENQHLQKSNHKSSSKSDVSVSDDELVDEEL